jgi:hypothetical protein
MNRYLILFSILFVSIQSTVTGQSRFDAPDSVEMTGMIFNDDNQVRDSKINIYQKNDLIKVVETSRSNRFRTNLPINSFLTIEITAPDYHTKRFIFDTTLPEDVKKAPDFEFDMDIFSKEEMSNVNTSLLDFPVGLVDYNPRKKKFMRNVEYTKKMKARYMKLLEESIMTERATE